MASICPHFLRGVCRYGPQCRQSHDLAHATVHPVTAQSPPARVSMQAPNPTPSSCKFFLEGRCNKGKTCPFRHPDAPLQPTQQSWRRSLPMTKDACVASPSTDPSNTQSGPQASFLRDPCKYFLKGICKNGSLCDFRHPDAVERSLSSPKDSSTKFDFNIPCKYYHQGRCTKGDACTYLHSRSAGKANNAQAVSPATKVCHCSLLIKEAQAVLLFDSASSAYKTCKSIARPCRRTQSCSGRHGR